MREHKRETPNRRAPSLVVSGKKASRHPGREGASRVRSDGEKASADSHERSAALASARSHEARKTGGTHSCRVESTAKSRSTHHDHSSGRYQSFRPLKTEYAGGYRGELEIEWSLRYHGNKAIEVYAVRCQNAVCGKWWGWVWDLSLARKTLKKLRKVGRCPACRHKKKVKRKMWHVPKMGESYMSGYR